MGSNINGVAQHQTTMLEGFQLLDLAAELQRPAEQLRGLQLLDLAAESRRPEKRLRPMPLEHKLVCIYRLIVFYVFRSVWFTFHATS